MNSYRLSNMAGVLPPSRAVKHIAVYLIPVYRGLSGISVVAALDNNVIPRHYLRSRQRN